MKPHEARHPQGLAAGRDDPAVRARRLQHLRQLALVLPVHRRPRDRVHADPRAGDGALRLRRRARRRPDRAGLDRRARSARRRRREPRVHPERRRPDLREAELRQGALGAGRARGLALQDGRRTSRARPSPPSWCASPRRTSSGMGVNGATSSSRGAPPRSSRRCSPTRIVEATETGSTLRANRLRIIDTRDGVEHAAHRQRRGAGRCRGSATKIENIALLLRAAIEAQGRVGLMLNVRRDDLARRCSALLPALQRPTISSLSDDDWVARQHDHRGAHGARPDPEAEGGRRPGHRRVSAEQDRGVADAVDAEDRLDSTNRARRRPRCWPPSRRDDAAPPSARRARSSPTCAATATARCSRYARQASIGLDGADRDPARRDARRRAGACRRPVRAAIRAAARNIRHGRAARRCRAAGASRRAPGVSVEQRVMPLDRVGCYVPGGRYPLPSSLLMTAIPAARRRRRARSIAVCPRPEPVGAWRRRSRPASSRLFRIGGAHAIAALAYGTATRAARRQDRRPRQPLGRRGQGAGRRRLRHRLLRRPDARSSSSSDSGRAGVDRRRPDRAGRARSGRARRADHPSRALANAGAPRGQSRRCRRRPGRATSLRAHGGIIVTRSVARGDRAGQRVGARAPGRRRRRRWPRRSRCAGSMFVGPWSAQVAGDYAIGSNHVLPTAGAARVRGGLSRRRLRPRLHRAALSPAGPAARWRRP